jgi:hypothetical protein
MHGCRSEKHVAAYGDGLHGSAEDDDVEVETGLIV